MNYLILLLLLPALSGLLAFALPRTAAKAVALAGSLASLALALVVCSGGVRDFSASWLPMLGASFLLHADSMSQVLCLLTALVSGVTLIADWNRDEERSSAFYGLFQLAQAGLMGVFLAYDGLLFYFFWELALVPVYFLCSIWGGEKRIAVTFKFFVYTFVGSLMMLSGLIYLSLQSAGASSFAWSSLVQAGHNLPPMQQQLVFWLFFIAFAIKMPIFPFHTWQPDTYEQAPVTVTIVLSALMVKMGIFAVLRWLLPVLPEGVAFWSNTVVILSIIGIIYASCLALVQTDVKRLVAYSSIAHMGLMCAAAFSPSPEGMHAIVVQMFNHGINITAMWLLAGMIEQRYGTRDMTKLGGMASAAPRLTVALVIVAFANIALPLTNGFIGEFMLFNGIFQSANPNHILYMTLAGLGVILGAVYTLTMVQKVAYGNPVRPEPVADLRSTELIGMAILIAIIFFLGVYPKPLLMAALAGA